MADDIQRSHDEQIARRQKVSDMRARGVEPWPAKKHVDATAQHVVHEYEATGDEEKTYAIAGRVVALRLHGKTAFAHVQDRSGKIQIYIRQDTLGEAVFDFIKEYIDLGDIVWCFGTAFRTKTGEVTLNVKDFALLSKCLHPLPEKFHGLADVETRYRQRYLDLISNPESRAVFKRRSGIVAAMRNYLNAHDFMEVETPMLHPIAGGAAAKPFVTHHNALHSDLYLRIAPELYLKRLVIGGFERVYEINRNFRNEGISTRHNPEFTMLEMYMAHEDYHYVMNFVENMLKHIVAQVEESMVVSFGDHQLDFSAPFARMTIKESLVRVGGYTEEEIALDAIDATLARTHVTTANKQASHGEKLFALFEESVESKLIQPTFITDFPVEVSPLAKRTEHDPMTAARFEMFVAGMELCNGFNELNDPEDQAQRFAQQMDAHAAGDEEAHQYDADYIQALEYGLPPTVGVGIGIDRLTMMLTGRTSIKDVILFPTLKKK